MTKYKISADQNALPRQLQQDLDKMYSYLYKCCQTVNGCIRLEEKILALPLDETVVDNRMGKQTQLVIESVYTPIGITFVISEIIIDPNYPYAQTRATKTETPWGDLRVRFDSDIPSEKNAYRIVPNVYTVNSPRIQMKYQKLVDIFNEWRRKLTTVLIRLRDQKNREIEEIDKLFLTPLETKSPTV